MNLPGKAMNILSQTEMLESWQELLQKYNAFDDVLPKFYIKHYNACMQIHKESVLELGQYFYKNIFGITWNSLTKMG